MHGHLFKNMFNKNRVVTADIIELRFFLAKGEGRSTNKHWHMCIEFEHFHSIRKIGSA